MEKQSPKGLGNNRLIHKSQNKRNWEKELEKCIASPYYFYTNYVMIETEDGLQRATTRMTEEEFNKAYYGK